MVRTGGLGVAVLLVLLVSSGESAQASRLDVQVTELRSDRGKVLIAVFQ